MSAVERALEDIEHGDLWLARRRLGSYLVSKGYDAEVLKLLGDVCHRMHDDYEAGRMWLASTAEGPDVERAIGIFVEQHAGNPNQIITQLPAFVRLKRLDAYAQVAQDRFRRIGLEGVIVERAGGVTPPHSRDWGCLIACVVLTIVGGLLLIGLIRTVRWLFGYEPFLL